jgi:putative flippase GtrA
MKKNRKLIIVAIIIILSIISSYKIYAVDRDPNSSKGFAEYDDAAAEEETKKLEEEQEKNFDVGKSTNNYLESLQVENYEFTTEFDKQTLEYTLTTDVDQETINIIATSSDTKASIEGIGNIKLNVGQNQCRVDVIAESGTVRTYIINVTRAETEEEVNTNIEETKEIDEEQQILEEEMFQKEDTNKTVLVIGACILLVLGIAVCIIISKSKFKYKEIMNYLVCGGLSTIVNFVVYFIATRVFGIEEVISSAISWFCAVLCAYITNKIFVFETKKDTKKAFIKEIISFFACRFISGILCDVGTFALMVNVLHINDIFSKIVTQVMVVIINYIFSKLIVFKK